MINTAGSFTNVTARSGGDLELIYDEHSDTLSRYGPPGGSGANYNLLSDRPLWQAVYIDFWWIGNGLRLQSPGGLTKIRGTKLQKSQNNENRQWRHDCRTATEIISLVETQTHGKMSESYFLSGHITILREPGGASGWIRCSLEDGIWAGCLHMDMATPFIFPLFSQPGSVPGGITITGMRTP